MLVSVEENRKWSERMSEDVLNLPTFSSWGGCSELPPKCIWITGIV